MYVYKLLGHASLVVFGSNNENEQVFSTAAQDTPNPTWNSYVYVADYVKLFIDVVMPAIRKVNT